MLRLGRELFSLDPRGRGLAHFLPSTGRWEGLPTAIPARLQQSHNSECLFASDSSRALVVHYPSGGVFSLEAVGRGARGESARPAAEDPDVVVAVSQMTTRPSGGSPPSWRLSLLDTVPPLFPARSCMHRGRMYFFPSAEAVSRLPRHASARAAVYSVADRSLAVLAVTLGPALYCCSLRDRLLVLHSAEVLGEPQLRLSEVQGLEGRAPSSGASAASGATAEMPPGSFGTPDRPGRSDRLGRCYGSDIDLLRAPFEAFRGAFTVAGRFLVALFTQKKAPSGGRAVDVGEPMTVETALVLDAVDDRIVFCPHDMSPAKACGTLVCVRRSPSDFCRGIGSRLNCAQGALPRAPEEPGDAGVYTVVSTVCDIPLAASICNAIRGLGPAAADPPLQSLEAVAGDAAASVARIREKRGSSASAHSGPPMAISALTSPAASAVPGAATIAASLTQAYSAVLGLPSPPRTPGVPSRGTPGTSAKKARVMSAVTPKRSSLTATPVYTVQTPEPVIPCALEPQDSEEVSARPPAAPLADAVAEDIYEKVSEMAGAYAALYASHLRLEERVRDLSHQCASQQVLLEAARKKMMEFEGRGSSAAGSRRPVVASEAADPQARSAQGSRPRPAEMERNEGQLNKELELRVTRLTGMIERLYDLLLPEREEAVEGANALCGEETES